MYCDIKADMWMCLRSQLSYWVATPIKYIWYVFLRALPSYFARVHRQRNLEAITCSSTQLLLLSKIYFYPLLYYILPKLSSP